jgi:hypothetical protein
MEEGMSQRSSFLLALCCFCLASVSFAADVAPRSSANAVFVGHSLINYDMPQIVQALAESRGKSMQKAVQVVNGAPLRYSWEVCRQAGFTGQWPPDQFACDAIERGSPAGAFDVLIATDANNSIESNRVYNDTHKYLENFMELLLSRNGRGRTLLYTSWEGWSFHKGNWVGAIESELAQYETIARQAEALSASRGRNGKVEVIPANLALRELVTRVQSGQVPGIGARDEIFSDDVHMTGLGNYYLACVVYAVVFNQSPEGATGRANNRWGSQIVDVAPATRDALQRLAWQVVTEYRGRSGGAKPRAPAAVNVL